MKKYKATAKGFDGLRVIHTGEVFEFDGPPGSWMEPLEADVKETDGKEDKSQKSEKTNKRHFLKDVI